MSAQIHVGDIGTVFYSIVKDETNAYVNISAASSRQMFFRKPDMVTVLTKTASYVTSYAGTDPDIIAGVAANAVMQWTTVNGDLNAAGAWSIQGRVVIGAATWSTDIHAFNVDANLA